VEEERMKKTISLLIVVLISVSVAGTLMAGGNQSSGSAAAGTKEVTLRGMHWTSSTADQQRSNDRFLEFTKKFPNIKIQFEWYPQGFAEKLTALFASNDAPDFFANYVGDLGLRVKNGYLKALTPYFNRDGFDKNPDLLPNAVVKYNGDVYGVVQVVQPQVLYYNKALFDKAGVPYPNDNWTWKDLQDNAQKLTVKDASGKITQYGFQCDEYCRVWISHFQSNGGQAFDNRDNPTKVTFNNDLGVESAQYLYDLVQSLNVSPPPGIVGVLGHRDSFANGIVAMILDGSWMNISFAQKEGLNYGVALVPNGRVSRGGWIAPTHFAMSSTTKNPEETWTFLKWWFGYDNSLSFSGYGKTLTSTGLPVWKSAYNDPAFKPDEQVSMIGKMVQYSVPDMTFQLFGTWYWDTLNVGLQEMVGNKQDPKAAIDHIAQLTQKNVLDEIER